MEDGLQREKGKVPEIKPNDVELSRLMKGCLESEGYVVFVARMTKEHNDKGFNIIRYDYRRYHFSFEDVAQATMAFKKSLENEIKDVTDGLNA
uniref:Uncharacterized protein n=1 Tax=viral metagenome TaxID=1070528 RepID=A0A6M3IVH7_9ZZZZ